MARLAYRVIGIDPALTNVGLVVLESPGPGRHVVTEHETVATDDKKPLLHRLGVIRHRVGEFLWAFASEAGSIVVVEDASEQKAIKRQVPRNICVMGVAIGVVIAAVQDLGPAVEKHLVGPDVWMPWEQTGNFRHIMPKPRIIRTLHSFITLPAGCTEHELMAAGVARFWVERERQAERVRKATA